MAPEVRLYGAAPTAAADVYGLGAFLWALATGFPPTIDEAEQAHSEIPPAVAAVCKKCLHADPVNRFRSVRALLAALSATGRSS
jgi:hypothetical protein